MRSVTLLVLVLIVYGLWVNPLFTLVAAFLVGSAIMLVVSLGLIGGWFRRSDR